MTLPHTHISSGPLSLYYGHALLRVINVCVRKIERDCVHTRRLLALEYHGRIQHQRSKGPLECSKARSYF